MRVLICFVLGALLPLAFAPFEWWWFAPMLVAAWTACWVTPGATRLFWTGFAFGAGAFLTGTYWLYHSIAVIGKAPLALTLFLMLGMVAIMALYFGATVSLSMWLAAGRWRIALFVLAPLYTVLEWLRGWVLSGFPWLNLGYTLPETWIAGWLPLGGVYLGTFALVATAAGLLWSVLAKGSERLIALGFVAALTVAGIALTSLQWSERQAGAVSVRIAQLGLDQSRKWAPEEFQTTLQWYGEFVREHAGADLLLAPEVAVPTVADRVPGYLDQLERFAGNEGSDLLLGILRRHSDGEVSNALLRMGVGERQWYDKRHLVPYGEFFPVPAFIRSWMKAKGLPFSDLKAGARTPVPLIVGGDAVATSICYEDAYANEQLTFFPDARYIVNVSNDAWFGDTIAPHQHLQIARTRSAESQRWQARATNTGITAIIDDRGRVVTTVPAFEPAVLSGEIERRAGHTPYTLLGDKMALLLSLVLLAPVVQRRLAARKHG